MAATRPARGRVAPAAALWVARPASQSPPTATRAAPSARIGVPLLIAGARVRARVRRRPRAGGHRAVVLAGPDCWVLRGWDGVVEDAVGAEVPVPVGRLPQVHRRVRLARLRRSAGRRSRCGRGSGRAGLVPPRSPTKVVAVVEPTQYSRRCGWSAACSTAFAATSGW